MLNFKSFFLKSYRFKASLTAVIFAASLILLVYYLAFPISDSMMANYDRIYEPILWLIFILTESE